MFIPILIIATIIIIISVLQIRYDPDRPFFQVAYSNNLDELITLSYKSNIEEYNELFFALNKKQTTTIQQPSTSTSIISTVLPHVNINPKEYIPKKSKDFLCNLIDQSGNTLYHWSAKNQALKVAEFLNTIGCDFMKTNFQGSSPFMWSATYTTLNPKTYLEYEMEDILRDAELKRQVDLHENEEEGGEKDHNNNVKKKKTNEPINDNNSSIRKYTHIPYNPMMKLLAEFARQRDIKQYRQQLMNQQQTAHTTEVMIEEQLRNYRPEDISTSYYNSMINHQNHEGENVLHFATQFLSVTSVKTLISLLPPAQPSSSAPSSPLITQITKESGNTAIHMLPPDCLENDHCKKILTFFILIGFNPMLENNYKRTLQHHIEYDKITPLLEIEDEFIIARYRNHPLDPHLQREYNLTYGGSGTTPLSKSTRTATVPTAHTTTPTTTTATKTDTTKETKAQTIPSNTPIHPSKPKSRKSLIQGKGEVLSRLSLGKEEL